MYTAIKQLLHVLINQFPAANRTLTMASMRDPLAFHGSLHRNIQRAVKHRAIWTRLPCGLAPLKRRDGTPFGVPSLGSAICAAMVYLRGSFSGQTIKPAWLPADHSSRSKVARTIWASRVSCHSTADARCKAS